MIEPRHIEVLDPLVAAALRRKTPGERIAMGYACHRLVRDRLTAHFRHEHPEWNEREIQQAVARRLLGDGTTGGR